MTMEKIKSFTVNHLTLRRGLYVSRVDGGVFPVTTFDLRMRRPLVEPVMDNPALHTIEHLGATFLRNSPKKDEIVYFGPMGCRTGFYLIMFGNLFPADILDLIIEMCDFILGFNDRIPGTNPRECGNYLEHNLEIAKFYIKEYKDSLLNEKNFTYPA